MLSVVKVDKNNAEHIRFLFDVRSSHKVAKMMKGEPPSDFESHTRWVTTNLVERFREIYILQEYNRLLGYFQFYNFRDSEECEVGYAVHPDFMGRGYGNRLVLESLLEAKRKGIKKIILFVKKNNHRAIHLYKKFGFQVVSEGDNEIKMEQDLCQQFQL